MIANGQAGFIVPPEYTFQTLYNLPWQSWPSTFDEASRDNPENGRRMLQDPVLTTPLNIRVRSTALLSWHIEPDDPDSEEELKAAADIEKRISSMPGFLQMTSWLLTNGIWLGRTGAQIYYDWVARKGRNGLSPVSYDPLNGTKLIFGYGEKRGRIGVRVNPISKASYEMVDFGAAHWFTSRERENLICYQHYREDPEFTQAWKAGALNGQGLRDQLYWMWGLKNQVLAFMMDHIQWFARGLTIYYYDNGNEQQLKELGSRVTEQKKSGLPILFFPRTRDGAEPGYEPVKRFEPGQASNQLIIELVTNYFDSLFRRAILGQDLTTTAAGGGLGDGTAALHGQTWAAVPKYDSLNLEECLTRDLVSVMYRYTYPGMATGRFKYESEAPNVEQLLTSAQTIVELGGQIDAEELRKQVGLPIPKPGSEVLQKQGSLDPSAVTQIPTGTPVVTPPDSQQPGPAVTP